MASPAASVGSSDRLTVVARHAGSVVATIGHGTAARTLRTVPNSAGVATLDIVPQSSQAGERVTVAVTVTGAGGTGNCATSFSVTQPVTTQRVVYRVSFPSYPDAAVAFCQVDGSGACLAGTTNVYSYHAGEGDLADGSPAAEYCLAHGAQLGNPYGGANYVVQDGLLLTKTTSGSTTSWTAQPATGISCVSSS